jgi:uncharacterized protein (DUF58 family)
MKFIKKINSWLENNWSSPTYSGCLLSAIALAFFGAATNTMAGWLYVLSGVIIALLALGAILPVRSIKNLKISRFPINPVSVGDRLTITLEIENISKKPQSLMQIRDLLPPMMAKSAVLSLELIPPQNIYNWIFYPETNSRGVYLWNQIELRSGSPLGLFWSRRLRHVPAKAIVYPTVLPLKKCPLIDNIGQEDSITQMSNTLYQAATQGITRTLRAYRQGDSTRLIHWRSSAKLGELQVRELEIITGGQEVIICLDTGINWEDEQFENAVIAAASLYFYASRQQYNVKLWTAATGLLNGNRVVLETLAGTRHSQIEKTQIPASSLIWITNHNCRIGKLPKSSHWLLFTNDYESKIDNNLTKNYPGIRIISGNSLQQQLSMNCKE